MPHSARYCSCRAAQPVWSLLVLSLIACYQIDLIAGATTAPKLLSRPSSKEPSPRTLPRRGLHQFKGTAEKGLYEDEEAEDYPSLFEAEAHEGELDGDAGAEDWTDAKLREDLEEYEDGEYEYDDSGPFVIGDGSGGFTEEQHEDFENMIKEEAHQEALSSGENPASLAAGTRNTSANATTTKTLKPAKSGVAQEEGSPDLDWDIELAELEAEEEEFEEVEHEQSKESSKIPTLPDESIERAINAHMPDPVPMDKSSDNSTATTTTPHEKATFDKLKDLQEVVDTADLDDNLAAEKKAEADRLSSPVTNTTKAAQAEHFHQKTVESGETEGTISKAMQRDSSATTLPGTKEPKSTPSSSGNATVLTQGVIMSNAMKDAVKTSLAIRIIAIILAAVAGCAVAWGSIVVYNKLRPPREHITLPKVIEIGAFTKKSPSYSRVRARGDEHQSGSWQDWDDDWDEQVGSQSATARRGSSVKLKPQKWDDDW